MSDIERYLNQATPERLESMADRLGRPSPVSKAGALDRSDGNNHLRRLRNVARQLELDAAETYAAVESALQHLAADDRRLAEMKVSIEYQRHISTVLAGDDPELGAKFGVLDDDHFRSLRLDRLMGRGRSSGF